MNQSGYQGGCEQRGPFDAFVRHPRSFWGMVIRVVYLAGAVMASVSPWQAASMLAISRHSLPFLETLPSFPLQRTKSPGGGSTFLAQRPKERLLSLSFAWNVELSPVVTPVTQKYNETYNLGSWSQKSGFWERVGGNMSLIIIIIIIIHAVVAADTVSKITYLNILLIFTLPPTHKHTREELFDFTLQKQPRD